MPACLRPAALACCAVAAALAATAPAPARAAAITYDLNTVIDGKTLTPSASYGTVTFADDAANAKAVDVTVALNGAGQKIQELFFNYDDAKFSGATPFVLTGDVTSYSISEDAMKAGGYSFGRFDVQTPSNGNIGTQPISFQISLAGIDLNPADFDFRDTSGRLFDAVHIGNCGTWSDGCLPEGGTGPASIWVGSSARVAPVPEPASVAMIGTGLLGLGVVENRRRRGQSVTTG